MALEMAAIPLAFIAGVLGVLSPCVWPLIPIVMGSAAGKSKFGPYALALGLSISFAVAGTLLSFILVNTGLDPELFRYFAAILLIFTAILLIYHRFGEWVSVKLSMFTSRFSPQDNGQDGWLGQFNLGLLLGLVWLPCVGPTLGAAIALASMGQQMSLAFMIMLSFGLGTALVLLVAGMLSAKVLKKVKPDSLQNAVKVKKFLGWIILTLGLLVLTGLDKQLEIMVLGLLPDWAIMI
ncbi:cytochrome c biogenesis CcdA family protein [Acinetobacter beijerinckii]|uniref:cytochrome c biogenesis CcdA family protein n=1 Tax=Acinetobacter beijerinckii TaxID=262668 RepID=UPI003AF42D0C